MKVLVALFACLTVLSACSSFHPNQDPTGKQLISFSGTSLDNQTYELPAAFEGSVTLILFGYVQDSQFDIDRWLIGLDMTQTDVSVYEVPAIQGMFPRLFSNQIDSGMRGGIPQELWKGVITVYKDGDKVQAFTGNENPNNARVVLIDKTGQIKYFYDRGFSVAALNQVRETLQALNHTASI